MNREHIEDFLETLVTAAVLIVEVANDLEYTAEKAGLSLTDMAKGFLGETQVVSKEDRDAAIAGLERMLYNQDLFKRAQQEIKGIEDMLDGEEGDIDA